MSPADIRTREDAVVFLVLFGLVALFAVAIAFLRWDEKRRR